MRAKITFISLSVLLMVIFLLAFLIHANPSALVCTARYHLALSTQQDGIAISGEVLQVFRIASKSEGVVSQVGVIKVNEKAYSVNRTTIIKFVGKDSDGYLRTLRKGIVKNENDDLPDAITDILMSKQKLFFYKVMPISGNIYGIRDLRRTIAVCRADRPEGMHRFTRIFSPAMSSW
ncbi:hypothetical protein [uncultured Enterobacter sp.]|uniref:hypothetical protein n=1 Tax=uncultured Enterobacter sp. TaxID=238202 RepID=UPI0026272509|nr:hypothetical protein [uncultured Enterobacter sp.]